MEYFFWYCLNKAVFEFSDFNIGILIAIQKKLVQLHEMGTQIKSSLLLMLHNKFIFTASFICLQSSFLFQHVKKAMKTCIILLHVSVIKRNILVNIIKFTRYHLLLSSNSAFMTDSLYSSTIQMNSTIITSKSLICQIDTNISTFQPLNMLLFHIRLEHLKLIYYSLISI